MGAYDVPLLDRIEANETDGQQVPSYFGNYLCAGCGIHTSQHLVGGGGWDRKIGSSRPSSAIQQVQRQPGIREILSQNARKEGRKPTGMLSLSCPPGPASVINHFLVCLRGFYFIDYFKR